MDAGAPQGDPKDMPAAKQWPKADEWQAAKEFGAQPDLIIEATSYTMPAKDQDVWWIQLPNIPDRAALGARRRDAADHGRGTQDHSSCGRLSGAGRRRRSDANSTNDADRQGVLMEWAVGKSYDIFHPNTGKLLLPGSKIWWDVHIHAVGEEIPLDIELAVWLYPKGQEPKYRTHLTAFPGKTGPNLDIPPNSIIESQGFTVLKQPAILENFQPHMHLRGKAMSLEAILPDGTSQMISYVDNFNFNWMTNYIYDDDAAPVLPKGTVIHVTAWHDNTSNNPNNPDPDQWVG